MVQYLIRLDDLCPTNNLPKWERFFELFDRYQIKPIIAVIPANRDPKLLACGTTNPDYWPLVRLIQAKGYTIGMHGFEHHYETGNAGMLKINKRSEFAGLPFHIQERKIKAAAAIFERERVHTAVFVAPGHTFDRATLLALNKFTNIRVISDGLLRSPYIRFGFKWIPVQLSEATPKTKHTWTFNYHPETCPADKFQQLEKFIAEHHSDFISVDELIYSRYKLRGMIEEKYVICKRQLRDLVKDQIARFKR